MIFSKLAQLSSQSSTLNDTSTIQNPLSTLLFALIYSVDVATIFESASMNI